VKFKIYILTLVMALNSLVVLAIENRPVMRRACLNKLDSTVDLLWFKPTDNCNSFTGFSIYGRDNVLSLYKHLGSYNNFSSSQVSLKLPNLRNWSFYLVYNKACNGIDSVFSDTIFIDNTPPADSQIDSVSVDLATQKTIIGWSSNPSKDINGYYVYYTTGSNEAIATTSNTTYLDNGSRNPALGSVNYSIAAYDSCNNASLISKAHATIFLTGSYNQCDKTISLSWNPYSGWINKNYDIYQKINNGAYKLVGSVNVGFTKFTYNFATYGDNYCFYIRAHKDGTGIPVSSSSNVICISTKSIIQSKNSYIAKASVQNGEIELTLITEPGSSLQRINVYKAGSGNFNLWQTINTTGGILELKDADVNVQLQSYKYYFTTEGPCPGVLFDSSQIAKTILLNVVMSSPGNQDLNWSLYSDFIKKTQGQELLLSSNDNFNKSSPWNILTSFDNTTKNTTDHTDFGLQQEKICYCIRAIENAPNPTFARQDTSYSNIQCVTADPIVYFPNAIQINGFNTTFIPKGVFIDYQKSSFSIYNRWGEVIYETQHIDKGWDGKEHNEFVQSDVYVYRATIIGLNGKTLYFDGTITVLK
jgi:gliding motility-associated-like protein